MRRFQLILFLAIFISKIDSCMKMIPSEPGIPATTDNPSLTVTTTTAATAATEITITTTTAISTTTTDAGFVCGTQCSLEPLLKQRTGEDEIVPNDTLEEVDDGCKTGTVRCSIDDYACDYVMYIVYTDGEEVEGEDNTFVAAQETLDCGSDGQYYYKEKEVSSVYCTATNCY